MACVCLSVCLYHVHCSFEMSCPIDRELILDLESSGLKPLLEDILPVSPYKMGSTKPGKPCAMDQVFASPQNLYVET